MAHRYWRLVGFAVPGNGPLELSEARLYADGVLADTAATLIATFTPDGGSLADLRDDLTTAVVRWNYENYSQPGFALVWDLGAGNDADITRLRLGASGYRDTFPSSIALQYSDAGVYWLTEATVANISFPGAWALTADPAGAWVYGHATWNPADKGPQCALSNANLTAIVNAHYSGVRSTVGVSRGKWYWELTGVNYPIVGVGKRTAAVTGEPSYPGADANGWGYFGFYSTPRKVTNLVQVAYGSTWTTEVLGVALDMDAGTLEFFKSGVSMGIAFTGLTGDIYAMAAGYTASGNSILTANFGASAFLYAPPAGFKPGLFIPVLIPHDVSAKVYTGHALPERLLPAAELPVTTAQGHFREFPYFDVYNGGVGLITGTVKEKSLPANVPLARKVWLMDEASGMVVRETWSDATTGNYEFRGVRQGVKYTVLAYDYTHTYRAVVADNLETT